MNTLQTLEQFQSELTKKEHQKVDLIVPSEYIAMDKYGSKMGIKDYGAYEPTDYAETQIAEKLGIPIRYYRKMKEEYAELLSANVNGWLQKNRKNYFVRTYDDELGAPDIFRAMLSDKFRPIDNLPIFREGIFPVIQKFGNDLKILGGNVSDTRMYLQFVIPSQQGEVEVGDIVQNGITIRNSEVGNGAVVVEKMIWRLICKNGLIRSEAVRKNHAGSRINADENSFMYKDDTIQAEISSFSKRLRDIVDYTLSDNSFEEELKLMRQSAEDKFTKPTPTIKNVTKMYKFTEAEGEQILENVLVSNKLSRWGVINGITALAHNTKDIDKQYDYERAGSKILDLSSSQWERVIAE